ncbi:rhomboid family intramembrane serine protease [Thalassobacillus sp. CUG 92003]|uniref:rhomboid family intramembrane serine protease n=1 Tax=Thalassobacillus sp. CUG 92003 TaxID=2736641 RepID=UPI0015E75909|nr:rhomboid family intramembrane serine protease [Thalassobacillus sp. CUG 92003]
MFIEQEYIVWSMAYDLAVNHDFEIVYLNETNNEIWLATMQQRKQHILRFQLKQVDWKNQLQQDLGKTVQQVKQNRHFFNGRNIMIHSVYVAEHPPVGEWEHLLQPQHVKGNKNMQIQGYYLSDDQKMTGRKAIYEQFGLSTVPIALPENMIELEDKVRALKQGLSSFQQQKRKEKERVFNQGNVALTYILLAINVAIYLMVEANGGSLSVSNLIEFGAKYNPAIIDGEWWRIVSSMFLHIGMLHLFMNMLALFYLGSAVERIFGTWRFGLIYFLAGIFGGMASFMLNPAVSAGASGAIFGLFGALLFFGLQYKRIFFQTMGKNLIFIIALNIVFGLAVPQIDNGAHIGGMVGGFIASFIVYLPTKRHVMWQSLAVIIYIGATLGMGIYGYHHSGQEEQTTAEVRMTHIQHCDNEKNTIRLIR